jgi:hypothetical protein
VRRNPIKKARAIYEHEQRLIAAMRETQTSRASKEDTMSKATTTSTKKRTGRLDRLQEATKAELKVCNQVTGLVRNGFQIPLWAKHVLELSKHGGMPVKRRVEFLGQVKDSTKVKKAIERLAGVQSWRSEKVEAGMGWDTRRGFVAQFRGAKTLKAIELVAKAVLEWEPIDLTDEDVLGELTVAAGRSRQNYHGGWSDPCRKAEHIARDLEVSADDVEAALARLVKSGRAVRVSKISNHDGKPTVEFCLAGADPYSKNEKAVLLSYAEMFGVEHEAVEKVLTRGMPEPERPSSKELAGMEAEEVTKHFLAHVFHRNGHLLEALHRDLEAVRVAREMSDDEFHGRILGCLRGLNYVDAGRVSDEEQVEHLARMIEAAINDLPCPHCGEEHEEEGPDGTLH